MTPATTGIDAMPTVAGPADRVHFLDEQRRHRRASWRFTALAALAVLVTGLPAAVVATPVVFTVALVLGYIADVFVDLPAGTGDWVRSALAPIGDALDRLDAGTGTFVEVITAALGLFLLALPGSLLILGLWWIARRIYRRTGVGDVLHRLGAREPNGKDAEERQIVNLVQEMAVAAGVPAPRVAIIDAPAANAAATGLGIEDATVVVTRGLLDRLDRDETQAVVGHVIASVGNGDLRIASTVFSIFQTWGALTLLMQTPFGPESRRTIRRAFAVAFSRSDRVVDRWEAEHVGDLLMRGATSDEKDDLDRFMDKEETRGDSDFRKAITAPLVGSFGLGSLVVKLTVFFSSAVLAGPAVSFLWRTRRYLADAMAVELTRNPDALARAYKTLGSVETDLPGGGPVSFLFPVWKRPVSDKEAVIGQFARMHPPLGRRLQRLRLLGATSVAHRGRFADWTRQRLLGTLLLGLLIGPLMVIGFGLMAVVIVMLSMLTIMITMVTLVVIYWILRLVFVIVPGWITG